MKFYSFISAVSLFTCGICVGQDKAAPVKPVEHLIGTVASADVSGHTVTVKDDATGVPHVIDLQNTKTLLRVPPGAKDLKSATRITAEDLAPGDRVDVRGAKADADPNGIVARSVVLMSGRDLQQAHQSEAAAWQHSTAGTVTAVDQADQKLTVSVRSPEGPTPVIVQTAKTVFSRYSPEHPQTANNSQFSDIQPGDQVKIIGEKSADGTSLSAQKIYSGSFRNVAGTVVSIGEDGKSLVVKDLSTRQPVTVSLTGQSSMHKLPPMMAMMLARRFNPDLKNAGGSPANAPANAAGVAPGERPSSAAPGQVAQQSDSVGPNSHGTEGLRGGHMGGGDLSQMLDRLPKITTADLKPGDAVIVAGSPSATSKTSLLASSVIAGVEPIFQSVSPRQAQSLGDWSGLGGGSTPDAGSPPQ